MPTVVGYAMSYDTLPNDEILACPFVGSRPIGGLQSADRSLHIAHGAVP